MNCPNCCHQIQSTNRKLIARCGRVKYTIENVYHWICPSCGYEFVDMNGLKDFSRKLNILSRKTPRFW